MLERLQPGASAANSRACILDFDGTISLIRSGWMDVMTPMMLELLLALDTGESERQLRAVVEEFIWRLTGKQTVYQMIELAEQVRKRGGEPLEPLEYKRMFLERLHARIRHRREELRSGKAEPDKYTVPGAREALAELRQRGLTLYLVSGTDEEYVREEADLLDLSAYFNGGIYGARDDYKSFSKKILIQGLISNGDFRGDEFLGFGDGYVEIENVKEVGGVAVGVASDEPECRVIDEWKRARLQGAGADFIVPNFLCRKELFEALFDAQ
jgi:phosphoglycolate phosphatase